MDGTWHLYRPALAWGARRDEIRAVLAIADRVAVGYALPDVELLPTARGPPAVGHLGPRRARPGARTDAHLAEAVRAAHRARRRRDRARAARTAGLAGIGNLYRTECCLLPGVSPWTPVRRCPTRPADRAGRERLMRNPDRRAQTTTGELGRGAALGLRARRAAVPPLRRGGC